MIGDAILRDRRVDTGRRVSGKAAGAQGRKFLRMARNSGAAEEGDAWRLDGEWHRREADDGGYIDE
jgi:hypothetical protein